MNYKIFVSYSMSLSSRAYELSAQLSRDNIMCYLDCMESGYTLGDYTRTILEESGVYVLLADKLPASPYATALLQSVTGMVKPMLVCLASDAALPGELRERCTLTTDATLLADIQCLLREEEEDSVSDSCADSAQRVTLPIDDGTEEEPDDAYAHAIPSEPKESAQHGEEQTLASAPGSPFAPFGIPETAAPTFTVTPLYGDEPKDGYDEVVYTERRGEDPVAEQNRKRSEAQVEALMHALPPHDDKPEEKAYDDDTDDNVYEGEFEGFEEFGEPEPEELEEPEYSDEADEVDESPLSDLERLKKMVSDIFDENPQLGIGLLIFLIAFLLEYCS